MRNANKKGGKRQALRVLGIAVGVIALVGGATVFILMSMQKTVHEPQVSVEDPTIVRQAELGTSALNDSMDESELNDFINNAENDKEKAALLNTFATYTLARDDLTDEHAERALSAAQRAYELDGQTSALANMRDAALRLGREAIVQEAEALMYKNLSETEGVENRE